MRDRRAFLSLTGATLAAAGFRHPAGPGTPSDWRRHFPAPGRSASGRPFAYLDSAATARRPFPVLEAVDRFYRLDNANPTGVHELGRRAAARHDEARRDVAGLIGAADPLEVIFTRGTTEAINLVAASWAVERLRPGDEILLSVSEHASNLVPWQMAARRTGARVVAFDVADDGSLRLDDFAAKLGPRTRLVAVSHVSNVLGIVNPVAEICRRAREAGAVTVVDAAQSVPHLPVDVAALGCDFLAFSSHKLAGPMGVGVLWGRRPLLEEMAPYQGGSNMAHAVRFDGLELSPGALKFGAGTPNVADAVGLGAAVGFLQSLGWPAIVEHGRALAALLFARLREIPGLTLVGGDSWGNLERIPLAAFNLRGLGAEEVARACDREGIALRAGDLAALPLLERFGTTTAVRASCYLYTVPEEIDRLAAVLRRLAR